MSYRLTPERLEQAIAFMTILAERPWNENALSSEFGSDGAREILKGWAEQDLERDAAASQEAAAATQEPETDNPASGTIQSVGGEPDALVYPAPPTPPNDPTPVSPDPLAPSNQPSPEPVTGGDPAPTAA